MITKGIAEPATKETLTRIEKKMLLDASQKKVHEELLLKTLESLNGASITIHGKANEKGHLFASIHKAEILAEIKRTTHLDMHPDYVLLDKPLKELGTFQIPINIAKHRAVFTVVVEAGE